MVPAIKLEIRPEEIIEAVKRMQKTAREAFLEDLLAAASPDYLESIREARSDYKEGKVKSHKEVFGH